MARAGPLHRMIPSMNSSSVTCKLLVNDLESTLKLSNTPKCNHTIPHRMHCIQLAYNPPFQFSIRKPMFGYLTIANSALARKSHRNLLLLLLL